MAINNLQDFYDLMFELRDARKIIVDDLLNQSSFCSVSSDLFIAQLKDFLQKLESIPVKSGQYVLALNEDRKMAIKLDYEINELKKDINYLEKGETAFLEYLNQLHLNFWSQVEEGVRYLSGKNIKTFITDRDGTVNNYCDRYQSSIQSIYNAVFLSHFGRNIPGESVVLTSAPLMNIGLADISVNPEGIFIYAGSKGREFLNENNEKVCFPIEPEKQKKLDDFNKRISELVKEPGYQNFGLIGSGLQFKFGQTTVARQDISESIPPEESLHFLNKVKELVAQIDPEGKYFRIEDTGKDIEVILTVSGESTEDAGLKDFDKGNGVDFLSDSLNLKMEEGFNLICGDTGSDVPMIEAAMKKSNQTLVIFVTRDEALKHRVKKYCPHAFFVTEPDILITILYTLTQNKK